MLVDHSKQMHQLLKNLSFCWKNFLCSVTYENRIFVLSIILETLYHPVLIEPWSPLQTNRSADSTRVLPVDHTCRCTNQPERLVHNNVTSLLLPLNFLPCFWKKKSFCVERTLKLLNFCSNDCVCTYFYERTNDLSLNENSWHCRSTWNSMCQLNSGQQQKLNSGPVLYKYSANLCFFQTTQSEVKLPILKLLWVKQPRAFCHKGPTTEVTTEAPELTTEGEFWLSFFLGAQFCLQARSTKIQAQNCT